LRPEDKVIAYHNYYQDLPFYLNRRVITVEVRDELSFGMKHQATQSWMLKEPEFQALWDSNQRIFLITNNLLYPLLKKEKKSIYLIASTSRNVLLSNRP